VISKIALVNMRTMTRRMMEKRRAAPQMIEKSQATEELRVTADPPGLPSPPVPSDAGSARSEMTEIAMKAPS